MVPAASGAGSAAVAPPDTDSRTGSSTAHVRGPVTVSVSAPALAVATDAWPALYVTVTAAGPSRVAGQLVP